MSMEVIPVATPSKPDTRRELRTRSHDADFSSYLAARQPALLRTAYLLTGSRASAEDLVQETMAKLYLAWPRVQRIDSLDGYVRKMMMNEHNSLWRRAWKRREFTTDTLPEVATFDRPRLGENTDLWAFVQTLPRKQRAVVVLRYYEDLSEAEVADVLGISVGTVKSQASRALAALRARAPHSLNPSPEEDRS